MQKYYVQNEVDLDYDDSFLDDNLADELFDQCSNLDWNQKALNRRSNITFGNNGLVYKIEFKARTLYRKTKPWTTMPILNDIKVLVEKQTGKKYNYCAVMRYPHGGVVIKKHRDKEMVHGTTISGVSVGNTRNMVFTPPYYSHNEPISVNLVHGSLYVMNPPTNDKWCHEIKSSECAGCRYSLTFRDMDSSLTEKDIPVYNRCPAILQSGKRKGEKCNNNIYKIADKACGRHVQF